MRTILLLAAMCSHCFAEQHGVASFYSVRSNGGTLTASGRPLNDHKLSAAHPSLPFGTVVKVTRIKTGKSIRIPITDRGPYAKGRVIDLSVAAAKALGVTKKEGITKVMVTVVKPPRHKR